MIHARIQPPRFFFQHTHMFLSLFLAVFCVCILTLTIRGIKGNPTTETMNNHVWKDEGPFELSPERGRFALLYSLLEDKSFQFSTPIAQFASPDVAFSNGHFVSLFAPALSLLTMPGYIAGKSLGIAQVGTYAVISFFAVLNVFLIKSIAQRMGASLLASTIAGLLFLFGTPAFAYAVSLYQHHVSAFLILSSLYVLHRWRNLFSLTYVWFACAVSVVLDNPNFFFMFPIGLYGLGRILSFETVKDVVRIQFKPLGILTCLIMIFPMAGFAYINYKSYGNPFQLAGTTANASIILKEQGAQDVDVADLRVSEPKDIVDEEEDESVSSVALGFFKTRNIRNGLYTHLISLDRGTLIYAPIAIFGVFGLFLYKEKSDNFVQLLLAVAGTVLVVYSMWGDPYGGWAFGSRYMIPAYAIASIGLAFFLTRFRKNIVILLIVLGIAGYSTFVNTVGALTTNRIPPKVQVLSLEEQTGRRQRYTFTRGMEMLNENRSKSFVFGNYAKPHLHAWDYARFVMYVIGGMGIFFVAALYLFGRKNDGQLSQKKNT